MIPGLTRMGYQKVPCCTGGIATNHTSLNEYEVSHSVTSRAEMNHDRSPGLFSDPVGN